MFARLREGGGPPTTSEPGRPTLAAWLLELWLGILPLDRRRRDLTLQGAAFAEQSAYDPAVGSVIAASDSELRGLLAALVRRAQSEGEVAEEVDADVVGYAFLAMAQGPRASCSTTRRTRTWSAAGVSLPSPPCCTSRSGSRPSSGVPSRAG